MSCLTLDRDFQYPFEPHVLRQYKHHVSGRVQAFESVENKTAHMNKVLHLNDSCYLSDSGGHSPDQSWADMHDPAAAFSGFPLSTLPQFTHWENEARREYTNLVGSLYHDSRQCMFHRWWFDVGCAALISLRWDGTQHDMIWYFLDSTALQHVLAHYCVMEKILGGRCSEARSETVRTNNQAIIQWGRK